MSRSFTSISTLTEVIGRTLETMLGSRRVTTYIDAGEEYDVIVEGERARQRTPTNLENLYVRSDRSGELIPLSNLVRLEEFADSISLNRYNRVRAITLQANLADGVSLVPRLKGAAAPEAEAIGEYCAEMAGAPVVTAKAGAAAPQRRDQAGPYK